MQQHTIAGSFHLSGVGLHSGRETNLNFRPAPENSGIIFVRKDLDNASIPATIAYLKHQPLRCTCLKRDHAEVFTVEHLMAVCYALSIDNLIVETDSAEMPGMDGSALPFYHAFKEAGIRSQEAKAKDLAIARPVTVEQGQALICASPSDRLELKYLLDHDLSFIPMQTVALTVSEENFGREIAPARTFVLRREAEQLQKMGMGKGANTKNTLVIDDDGNLIDNELRFPDEFARHKLLDLLGDLALLGKRLKAHVFGTRSGHALNASLVAQLTSQVR